MRVVSLIIPLLFLTACASNKETTTVLTVDKPNLVLPQVDSVHLDNVKWYVVDKNSSAGGAGSVDVAFKDSKSDSLFAISTKGYENLSINTAKLTRAVKQLQAQVKALKDYYQESVRDSVNDKR
jgi:hypothetical protein